LVIFNVTTKNPLVSVIMNCHNGELYLKESIDSLINQTYRNWEMIFWDNVSTDNSKKILEQFKDKRIKYFKSNKFTSLYEARNLSIEKAQGDYIGFLDTDDLWHKEKIEKQINFLKKNSDYKVVYSNFFVLDENKNKQYIRHKISLPSGSITQKLLDHYSLGILTVFLERNFFQNFKFKKDYSVIGDFDFFITLSQKFKIASIQEPLAFYRIHRSNFSIKRTNIYIEELNHWIETNKKTLTDNGFSIKKQKFLLKKLKIKYFLKRLFRL